MADGGVMYIMLVDCYVLFEPTEMLALKARFERLPVTLFIPKCVVSTCPPKPIVQGQASPTNSVIGRKENKTAQEQTHCP